MMIDESTLPLPIEIKEESIIKVMGVGGGGCNAVNYMYRQGIKGVTFLVCNTDKQVLDKSSVPAKLQLGPGLGAGGNPDLAQKYADEGREFIREALDDGTQMLFITAGMGGGTGTGASAVVAEVAQSMNILTVGIVTIPFAFEGKQKIRKALTGVAKLAEHVDAILIINNEKLKQIYSDLTAFNAFSKSDDVVANAAKSIAEIITVPGYINTDFADVYNTLKNGNVAIMNVGQASGECRITAAINNALQSPLANTNDVHGAKRVLLQFYCSTEHAIIMQEFDEINRFVEEVGDEVEVQWGVSVDDSLGEDVRVTIIATGYAVSNIPSMEDVKTAQSLDEVASEVYDSIPSSAPKEDEQAAQVDLTASIEPQSESEPVEQPAAVAQPRVAGTSDNEIVITFEDDDDVEQPTKEQPKPSTWSRWTRR